MTGTTQNTDTSTKVAATGGGNSEPTSPIGSPKQSRGQQQRIGPYILGKTLGVGSTGRVKAGTHMETSQKVAIKIISKESTDDRTDKKMEREITIMKLIQHPNVLQIYDVYEGSKELYLVLEQVEGGELFDYLVKRGRLSETEALYFFQQIVCGVEYCHRHLICHRDLKPENLLLDKEFNVKVADFGMASLQVPTKMLETSCGSPHYASPEIIKGEKYDGPTSDVWSCGIILYALLTGNLPFDDENIRKLLNKVKTGLYIIPEHVSASPKDLLQKMLTVDPAQRPSLREVMAHPWFNSKEPKHAIKLAPSPFETDAIEQGYPESYEFETDLLDALKLLGWTNNEQLIANLRAKKNNPEKVFYNLLHKRKWEMLENYNNDKEKYDNEDVVRRSDSMDGTNDNVHKRVPTDIAKKEGTGIDTGRRVVSDGSTPSAAFVAPGSAKRAISPLGASDSSNDMLDENNPGAQDAQLKKEDEIQKAKDELKAKQKSGRRRGPLAINTTDTTVRQGESGPLSAGSQSILTSGPKSAGLSQTLAALTVATPRFHRKGQLLDSIPVPMSPMVSTAPKTSWFTGLFNFKPEMYYLISSKNMDDTTAKLEQILQKNTITYKILGPGHLKCKLSNSQEGGSFKIEIVPNDAEKKIEDSPNGDLRVQFIHKQGAFSVFQSLVQNIQAEWAK